MTVKFEVGLWTAQWINYRGTCIGYLWVAEDGFLRYGKLKRAAD